MEVSRTSCSCAAGARKGDLLKHFSLGALATACALWTGMVPALHVCWLIGILQDGCCCYSHFTDEETGSERLQEPVAEQQRWSPGGWTTDLGYSQPCALLVPSPAIAMEAK